MFGTSLGSVGVLSHGCPGSSAVCTQGWGCAVSRPTSLLAMAVPQAMVPRCGQHGGAMSFAPFPSSLHHSMAREGGTGSCLGQGWAPAHSSRLGDSWGAALGWGHTNQRWKKLCRSSLELGILWPVAGCKLSRTSECLIALNSRPCSEVSFFLF